MIFQLHDRVVNHADPDLTEAQGTSLQPRQFGLSGIIQSGALPNGNPEAAADCFEARKPGF